MQTPTKRTRRQHVMIAIARWFDTSIGSGELSDHEAPWVAWARWIPFLAVHLMCFAVIWVGWSWTAVAAAAALYLVRMFAVTGFYHRYFSHRTFKTSRPAQFAFALLGNSAMQRGPLWWAANHRHHHAYSDTPKDLHSPVQHGFWWSHLGWITEPANFATNFKAVPDLAKYPELRFLDRFDVLVPALLGTAMFVFGVILNRVAPSLETSGMQMLVWGFFISTVVLFHATSCINSFTHLIGRKRYPTGDESRNNLILALITMGEGWHNNHHFYPSSVRQGFFWWEIDLTYYGLLLLEQTGLIWDLKPVPDRVRNAGPTALAASA
jgi:stearoyl-CoA desaturase (delta-9 desaturase)